MNPRILITALPFTLLAACGGSEPVTPATDGTSDTASATTTETPVDAATPADAAAAVPQAETVPETDVPAPAAPASQTAVIATPVAVAPPPPEFAICRACHSVEPAKNGVGPTLFGIAGSKAGEVPGYPFSPALKDSGIVWSRSNLDKWLASPMKMVPGTKMVISVPDPAKRKAIIDYLETLK